MLVYYLSQGFKARWFTTLAKDSRHAGLLLQPRIQGMLVYYLSQGFKARWFTTLAKDSRHAGLLLQPRIQGILGVFLELIANIG